MRKSKELEKTKSGLNRPKPSLKILINSLNRAGRSAALKSQIDLMEQTNQPAEQIDQLQALYNRPKPGLTMGKGSMTRDHELAAAKPSCKGRNRAEKGWDKYFAGKAEYEESYGI